MIDLNTPPVEVSKSPLYEYLPASAVCLRCGHIAMFDGSQFLRGKLRMHCDCEMWVCIPRYDDRN